MKALAGIAALTLMTGIAVAQTTAPAPGGTTNPQSPSATQPAPTPPSGTTATKKMDGAGSINWYQRANDDWPASEIIGTTVRNTAGENIGDVNELILSNEGKIRAVVIGVGGFLGMGERDVAVAFDSLKISRDEDNDEIITVDATKAVLSNAPQWERRRTGG